MRTITKRGVEIAQRVNKLRSRLMAGNLTLEETDFIMSEISDENIELGNIEKQNKVC